MEAMRPAPVVARDSCVSRVVHTRWLDAEDYASLAVVEDVETVDLPAEIDRNRALQLLARASRERRRTLPTPLRGRLALLR
jgi:hypothetical protein